MTKPSDLEIATAHALSGGLATGSRRPERMIRIMFRACDGARMMRRFKTLEGARRFAQERIGSSPEIGGSYAVSGDGIGTVRVDGASLRELFPRAFL